MAGSALDEVEAGILFIVGGKDPKVLDLNRQALEDSLGRISPLTIQSI